MVYVQNLIDDRIKNSIVFDMEDDTLEKQVSFIINKLSGEIDDDSQLLDRYNIKFILGDTCIDVFNHFQCKIKDYRKNNIVSLFGFDNGLYLVGFEVYEDILIFTIENSFKFDKNLKDIF